ncbi:MAG: hypothetical protein AAF802_01145 [Planctomycetota bacterium]
MKDRIGWGTWVLSILIVSGLGRSLYLSMDLRELSRERDRLEAEFGKLDIEDPDRVYVTRVKSDAVELPPGVQSGYVWQYRVYLPANYARCTVTNNHLIAAEGARRRGGNSSSSSALRGDAAETIATVAILNVEGDWLFTFTMGGGASTTRLRNSHSFDSFDDLLIDEPFKIGQQKSFSPDDAICLARLRLPEPAETTKDGVDLYLGFSVFLMDTNSQSDFERWAKGEILAMPSSGEDTQ